MCSHVSVAQILDTLNEDHVPSDDRRAVFVGMQPYEAADDTVIRDLFGRPTTRRG